MPNTLAHLGIQGLATRAWLRSADPSWIFLGCIIPDLPWIGNRIVLASAPWIDPYELRLYAIAQASLLCSLLAAGAFAALARSPRIVFAILAFNALLHLLLDALQTKWGNGVHIVAPLSWRTWNVGLFWPESLATYLLTALGLGYAIWALRRTPDEASTARPGPPRIALCALLLCAYLALPLALRNGPRDADSSFVETVRRASDRAGRVVELDRAWLEVRESGAHLQLGGDEILAVGRIPERSARVSLRGRFRDATTLEVEAFHLHDGRRRDVPSYLGLGFVALLWARSATVRWRARAGSEKSHPGRSA